MAKKFRVRSRYAAVQRNKGDRYEILDRESQEIVAEAGDFAEIEDAMRWIVDTDQERTQQEADRIAKQMEHMDEGDHRVDDYLHGASDSYKVKTLGVDHAALTAKLRAVLDQEPNPVSQQVAIELLTADHAVRMGSRDRAHIVSQGIHKHVEQLIDQIFDFAAEHKGG